MSRTTVKFTNRIDRRAGQQGSRPSVRGQAEVEKYVTGRHYSGVASPTQLNFYSGNPHDW